MSYSVEPLEPESSQNPTTQTKVLFEKEIHQKSFLPDGRVRWEKNDLGRLIGVVVILILTLEAVFNQ